MVTLEEKLDTLFSIYIRSRFADYKGTIFCYTCTTRGHWTEFDCGHWIGRANEAVRWDADNARCQCTNCNRLHNGRPEIFEEELREELGNEAVEKLVERSKGRYPDTQEKESLLIHLKGLVKGLDIAV